ncbi:MAG TPA: calcium-binding protein [Planctomycetota bacterium]|nr:calcium-binding protein [Planctomycetota bacterium]
MRIASIVVTSLALSVPANAQVISRISVDGNGNPGNAQSGLGLAFEQRTVAISADGNVIAFASAASNLVAGDGNGTIDIFVVDRVAGTIERVSVDSTGIEADADCVAPAISADGNVVAFWSRATNLVANDTNGAEDTFLHDRSTGITERASVNTAGVEGDLGSYRASLSSDGMLVAFESNATNLAVVDTNKSTDIFLRDRAAGTTRRVSLTSSGTPPGPGGCFDPSISSDGSRVTFSARATDLVPGDTNGHYDVFVRDRVAATTVRVSVDSSGLQGDSTSWHPTICADGSTVAFESYASNLVPGDVEGQGDVFVHELASGITERVSVDGSGNGGDGESNDAVLSADGKFVAFSSLATNLFANDANGVRDVFLRDRAAGTTAALSLDVVNFTADGASGLPALSDDATRVAFSSVATNLVGNDTNGVCDVFLDDVSAQQPPASWTNYGAGFPGTNGIPSLVSSANPVLGSSITLAFDDSYGIWTVGIALFGLQSASIPTTKGGTLLVQPFLIELASLPPSGGAISGTVPRDATLYGVSLFAQVLELDPGAAYGMSFTPGLQLTFGR